MINIKIDLRTEVPEETKGDLIESLKYDIELLCSEYPHAKITVK